MEHDHIAQDVALNSMNQSSGACGSQKHWSVSLTVAWSSTTTSPTGESTSFGFSIGVLIGCKNDKLLIPQPVFSATKALPTQGSIPKAKNVGTKTGFAGQLAYSDTYTGFEIGGQASLYNSFDLAVKGSLAKLGIPITVGMAVCFPYPPFSAPTGFSVSIPFEFDAETDLGQVAVSDEHVQHNTQMLVALSKGIDVIEKTDIHHHLKSAFASTSDEPRTTHQHALHAALNVDKHKNALLQHAVKQRVDKGTGKKLPIDIDVGGASNFALCLVFPCLGQD